MTPFDFDTITDRTPMASAKWARRPDAQKAAGVVPMSVADMELPCAPAIIQAMRRAADHGLYGYTDADAPYRQAVVDWMQARHGWTIQPKWIVPENGIVPAISVAVRALSEVGDHVLIQSPGYGPFHMMTELNGRVPVFSPLRQGADGLYRMDLEDLREKAAHPRAKVMILCSPHNPVGRIWTGEELRALADICRANDLYVISDEIHFDLALYGRHTVLTQAAPEMADRAIICTAPSKTFNLAGLQLANMIIADGPLRERYAARLLADGYTNVSYFGYQAILAAYREGGPWLDALLDHVRGNVAHFGAWLARHLPMVRLTPVQGTYLAWTDWRALGMTSEALSAFLREEALLTVTEGPFFGEEGEGFMRFNLALPRAALEANLARLLAAAKARGIA